MPEIHAHEPQVCLNEIREGESPLVYLIFGEPFLCKRALGALLRKIFPEGEGFGYEPLDGTVVDVREAVQRIATFSLFSEKKVVALLDARVFSPQTDSNAILKKAKEAYETDETPKAARYLLTWMAASRIDFEDMPDIMKQKKAEHDPALVGNGAWIEQLLSYCKENNLSIPDVKSDAKILEDAVRKGLPKGNFLIVTASRVDARMGLYQAIAEKGRIIDCSVPAGNTAKEKKARDDIFKVIIHEILKEAGKTLDPDAYTAVCEMTGFELGVLKGNLEKLIAFTGDHSRITLGDVQEVLSRTKVDPIFELTGAIMERNSDRAFFFLDSLLKSDFHPMAILSALTHQVRRLIVAREFFEKELKEEWHRNYPFGRFREKVLPMLESHGKQIEAAISSWEKEAPEAASAGRRKKKKTDKTTSDLVITRGGSNAYPAFKLIEASERFREDELIGALMELCDTDRLLKSTPLSPRLLLEKVIFTICNPSE